MAYMKCALSKRVPDEPVLSTVSHRVFERSVIEKYIDEHGTDPVSEQPLTKEQLIEIVKDDEDSGDTTDSDDDEPRGPTVRSMPELLTVLQREWEAANKERVKPKVCTSRKEYKGPLVDAKVLEVIATSGREAAFGDVHPWYEPWHIILEKLFPLSSGYLVTREFNGLIAHVLLVVSKHVAGKDPRVVLLGAGTLTVLAHRDPGTKSMLMSCIEDVANDYLENGVAFERVYWLGFMGPRCGWGWIEGGQVVNRVEGYWHLVQTEESQQCMLEMGAHLRQYIDG